MKRGNFQIDLIISGDWHLMEQERNPPCRTDSIWDAQWGKVQQIRKLQAKYDCPIFLSGDLFDHWKTSPNLINKTIQELSYLNISTVAGNHDLPQHNYELLHKSGLDTLFRSGCISPFFGHGDWGKSVTNYVKIKNKKIIVSHEMTYLENIPYPGCEDPECSLLFKKYPEADLIITGHNHETFTCTKKGRSLINPGSLTRHKADQIDHKPCVFLWNAETNTAKTHYLKVQENIISRDHIEIQNQKEKNIQNFLMKLKETWEIGLSFEDNIQKGLKLNKIPQNIQEIILKWINK